MNSYSLILQMYKLDIQLSIALNIILLTISFFLSLSLYIYIYIYISKNETNIDIFIRHDLIRSTFWTSPVNSISVTDVHITLNDQDDVPKL
jgi:hypothetical protein